MKRNYAVFLLTAIFAAVSLFSGGCSKPPEPPPACVVSIIVCNDEGPTGVANAVLVDPERGFFATNSHVIAHGPKYKLQIAGKYYSAETRPEWINWKADIALVRVAPDTEITKIAAPTLEEEVPIAATPLTVKGYVIGKIDGKDKIGFNPYFVGSRVVASASGWGVSLPSRLDVLELLLLERQGEKIPSEKLHILYERYILIEKADKTDPSQYRDGLSGSAAFGPDGKIIGILSSSGGNQAMIVPAFEIMKLLKKTNDDRFSEREK